MIFLLSVFFVFFDVIVFIYFFLFGLIIIINYGSKVIIVKISNS